MPWIETHTLKPGHHPAQLQIYNGLDCMVTEEVFEALQPLYNESPIIYDFERALQAPYLEIMLRGFAVDEVSRRSAADSLKKRIAALDCTLQQFAFAVWGKALNPRSPKQLIEFFYQAMALPEQWTSIKGQRKLSTNRESLEKLEVYLHARPIVACILSIRDLSKQLEVLETEIDPDGRMRTSYNIAGTETGRPSSSSNAFGTGGNLQNISPGLRYVFVADPGWKLCVIDAEQSEARDIGFWIGVLFNDWKYLDACESGDLHTANAKLIWPNLPWTGDPKKDRAIADEIFYRDFSYRDMSKRGGHAKNYFGTDWTVSRHLKVPVKMIEGFTKPYFGAYPGIPRLHQWTAQEVQTKQVITTAFGRTRHFFGRPGDDATLREAIANLGQSPTADRTNLGLWRIWKHMGSRVQLLAQTYDSVTFQYRESDNEAEVIAQALAHMEVELFAPNGRRFVVPGEAKVGWNWGYRHDEGKPIGPKNRFNPDGLVKWKGRDARVRSTGLQRVII